MAISAKDQVRFILAETERRRRIWGQMKPIAQEVVSAVTEVARQRGVRGQKWLGGDSDGTYATITFPTYESRVEQAATAIRNPRRDNHTLMLDGSGRLHRSTKGDTYQGYPELHSSDIGAFRKAAVEQLMASLNAYIERHRKR